MSTETQNKSISENVIFFRPRREVFALPQEPSNEELAFNWTISKEDKAQILRRRGDDNRRRYAVQLCVLRKYGRFLDDYGSVAAKIIGYLSRQLEIEPVLQLTGSSREPTENEYRNDISQYLGYSDFNESSEFKLEKWVLSLISDDYFTADLLPKAEEFLFKQKIVLPPPERMQRNINAAYAKAEQILLSTIADNLSEENKAAIDKVLDTAKGGAKTLFFKFGEYPPEPKAKNIRFISSIERESKNAYELKHRRLRKEMKKGVQTLEAFAKLYLSLGKDDPVGLINDQISHDQIKQAVGYCHEYRRLEETGKIEILQGKYPNFKRYFPLFLTLNFQAEKGAQYLLDAINITRDYHTGSIKKLPGNAAITFIPKNWRKVLTTKANEINPRVWEISLGFAIRDALKSGDLFIPESVHYISFWNMIYDEKRWLADREKIYIEQGFPEDGQEVVLRLSQRHRQFAETAIKGIPGNHFLKVKDGSVRFAKDEPDPEPIAVKTLRQLIEASLPKIRIEQLLLEVDALCGFSNELRPLEGFTGIDTKLPERLAALVAHGTNLGIHAMAECTSGISIDVLQDISRACFRVDSLKAANAILVNYQKNLEAGGIYGQGKRSSSDGQRFGVNKGSLITSMYPRYFGYYDKAVTVYTHVSDQYSVFNTQIISCADNEALYVIDGLLDNQSSLDIEQHHTDTGGYTDHIFALCFLLGFSYMPRLKNLHKRRLYKINKTDSCGPLEPLFKGTINLELITEQWDTMVRLAASLKNRIVPARVITQRLSGSTPADRLSKALTELGRLLKTIYILNYIQDGTLRRQVHKQLNLGEHRHAVARYIFFANRGEFRSGDLDEIMNKATCLSLLSNAVLVWNTVHMAKIVAKLRQNGHNIEDKDLARVSPLMHKHIFVNGTYDFSRRPPLVI